MRLPTGHLPRLTGWIANCGRLACSWEARTNCRRVSPTLSMAAVRCWKSNAATAITRKPSTWRT
jgi:hypothetical protein